MTEQNPAIRWDKETVLRLGAATSASHQPVTARARPVNNIERLISSLGHKDERRMFNVSCMHILRTVLDQQTGDCKEACSTGLGSQGGGDTRNVRPAVAVVGQLVPIVVGSKVVTIQQTVQLHRPLSCNIRKRCV